MHIPALEELRYSSPLQDRRDRSTKERVRHRGRARALPRVPARYHGVFGTLSGQGPAAVAPAAVQEVLPAAGAPAAVVPGALGNVVNLIVR